MPAPKRRIAAPVLATLAAVALVASLIGGYTWRALFDAEQFSDRATTALENEAVRDEIGRRVADQLILLEPNLIGVQPVLEGVVSGIAGQSAFESLFRAGVNDLHRTVFEGDTDTVTLTLADIGTTIRGTLEALQPKLAKKIPAKASPEVLTSDPPAVVTDLVRLAHDLKWLAIILLIVGLVLAGLSVRAAGDRRRGALRLGLTIALVSVLALVGLSAARAILLSTFDDQGVRDAIDGIWDAYVGDLSTLLLLVAACGAVLAAAASSLLQPVDVGAQLARAWAFVTAAPESRGWRAVRGAALVVVGVLIVARHESFLSLLAILIGLYVVYAGVAELMRLTIAAPEVAPERQRVGKAAIVATTVTAAAILIAAAIFIRVGGISQEPLAIDTEGCNGSEALCERTLDTVAFASTHNSMSAATNPGWLFAQHELGLPDQLRDGVRGYLIDAHYGVETADGTIKTDLSDLSAGERATYEESLGPEALAAALRTRDRIVDSEEVGERKVYLCHRFCELGALPIDRAFSNFRDFLAANPEEVLVVVIEDYVDPEEIADAAERTGLLDYIYKGTLGPPWPTLQEMIDSGGRVLMMAENEGGGSAIPWYHVGYDEVLQETPFSFNKPGQLTGEDAIGRSCVPNRGPRDASLFLINHWIDTSPSPRPSNAAKVNAAPALLARIRECERRRDLLANLIAVDFYRRGGVFEVTEQLNRERERAAVRDEAP